MIELTEEIDIPKKDVEYYKATIYHQNHIESDEFKIDVFLNSEEYASLFGTNPDDRKIDQTIRTLCAYEDLSWPQIIKKSVKMMCNGTQSFQDIEKFIFMTHILINSCPTLLDKLKVKFSIMGKFKDISSDELQGSQLYDGSELYYHGKFFSNNTYRLFFSDDTQVYAYADPTNKSESKFGLTPGETYDNISFDFSGASSTLWLNYNYPKIHACNIRKFQRG